MSSFDMAAHTHEDADLIRTLDHDYQGPWGQVIAFTGPVNAQFLKKTV
jgi:hypothetical protein